MNVRIHSAASGRIFLLRSFGLLALAITVFAQPNFSGKISGGFKAPSSTDADGRRHVIKGEDVISLGNNLLEMTKPRVTRYNPDDSADMFIESPRCFYQTKAGVAYSSTNLLVKTVDSRFSIEGVGWHWDLSGSLLVISNNVAAVIQKAAISALGSGRTNTAGNTNAIRITSTRFQLEGDAASFLGAVLVKDGDDTVRCERLTVQFVKPGGAQKVEAFEKVDIQRGDTRIRSGRALYDVKDNLLKISESPIWSAGQRQGSADLLVLNRMTDSLSAEGSVYMKLPLTNLVLSTEGSSTNASETNRFVEIHSDRFNYENARSNRLANARYTGHVRAVQDEATLSCQELAIVFGSSNRVTELHAVRDVKIQSAKNSVFGNEAEYDFESDKLRIEGEPRWELNGAKGRSDKLVFFPQKREVLALKNVEMIVPGRSLGGFFGTNTALAGLAPQTNAPMKITAESLAHSETVSVFQQNVLVADARGTIACDVLTVYSGSSNQVERIVAERSVVIKQPDMVALGERAEYEQTSGLVRLTGKPELLAPGKQLRADFFLIDRNRNTFSVSPGKYRIELDVPKKEFKNPFAKQ